MKKGLKILGYTLGALVLLLGLGATYVQMRGIPTYPVQAPALQYRARQRPGGRGPTAGRYDLCPVPPQRRRYAQRSRFSRRCGVAIKPLPYPAQPIATPPATDQVTLGRYLVVGRYECYSCHSASFQSVDLLEPEKTPGYLGVSANRAGGTSSRRPGLVILYSRSNAGR